jgi:hypothetical protein
MPLLLKGPRETGLANDPLENHLDTVYQQRKSAFRR